jgi:hypothetical protein
VTSYGNGDEGDGGALVEQGDGSGDLLRLNAAGGQCGKLFGDTGVDAVHESTWENQRKYGVCSDGRPICRAG